MLSKIFIFVGTVVLGATLPAAETIVTRDGTSYTNVIIQRAEPNGIVIEYTPAPGSVGVAKLKFQNLPEEIQRRHGYDPGKAWMFEQNQARAVAKQLAAQAKAERDAETEKTRIHQERLKQWAAEDAAAIAAAKAERQMQEQAKQQAAQFQETARQQKAADDAAMHRWRIQDNQLDSIDRGIRVQNQQLDSVDRGVRIQNYQLDGIGRDLNDINRKLR